jgi:hypothetical protein
MQPVPDSGDMPDAGGDAGEMNPPDSGTGALLLQPGEVAEITIGPASIGSAQLATPNGNERFIVMLASTQLADSTKNYQYSLFLDPGTPPTGVQKVEGCSIDAGAWAGTSPAAQTPPTGTAVSVGAMRMLDVPTAAGFEAVPMQAIRVTGSSVVWADISASHPAQLDGGFVDAFLSDFDSLILPREHEIFGVESDQDMDGHIGLVFSPLTYQTAVAFFTQCDLQQALGCPSSNHGEFLYLTPPNAIAPPYNTPNAMKEILAHECSHMIHFNQKVLRNQLTSWPDSAYVIEGVGGFAQDVVGPQAGNMYVAKAGLDGIDKFSIGETFVQMNYDMTRDGVLRGAGYLFVRYLYDRGGGDLETADGGIDTSKGGTAFLRELLDSSTSIAATLPGLTQSTPEDIATDFYTALAMSDREHTDGGVAPTNGCFAYLPAPIDPIWNRQRGTNIYASFSAGTSQMTGPATQDALNPDRSMRAGGVEYLLLDATPGESLLGINVSVDATAKVRARVGRLQ